MPDSYTYPDSEVLINNLGIQDYNLWKETENELLLLRIEQQLSLPLVGSFDFEHLRRIHKHLVQDLYSWGGELRTVDTQPGSTGIPHCRPQFIADRSSFVFRKLPVGPRVYSFSQDDFSSLLSSFWGELTALHPFRDGNTRSQSILISQFSNEYGWEIDWGSFDNLELLAAARTRALTHDSQLLKTLIDGALHRAETRVSQTKFASFGKWLRDTTSPETEAKNI